MRYVSALVKLPGKPGSALLRQCSPKRRAGRVPREGSSGDTLAALLLRRGVPLRGCWWRVGERSEAVGRQRPPATMRRMARGATRGAERRTKSGLGSSEASERC